MPAAIGAALTGILAGMSAATALCAARRLMPATKRPASLKRIEQPPRCNGHPILDRQGPYYYGLLGQTDSLIGAKTPVKCTFDAFICPMLRWGNSQSPIKM